MYTACLLPCIPWNDADEIFGRAAVYVLVADILSCWRYHFPVIECPVKHNNKYSYYFKILEEVTENMQLPAKKKWQAIFHLINK